MLTAHEQSGAHVSAHKPQLGVLMSSLMNRGAHVSALELSDEQWCLCLYHVNLIVIALVIIFLANDNTVYFRGVTQSYNSCRDRFIDLWSFIGHRFGLHM